MKRSFGVAFLVSAVPLILFAVTISTLQTQEGFWGIDDSWPILVRYCLITHAGICFLTGFKFMSAGMRCLQLTAEQLLASDPRPPVILLRSFSDDTLALPVKAVKMGLVNITPKLSAEIGVATALKRIGPVVAIGRPGDLLPQLGAARTYVPDSEWQAKIAQWMRISRVVIMLVHHTTPGTHWELDHAIAHLPPQRLVLYFPDLKETGEIREEHYSACRRDLASKFPRGLPESLGASTFILFDFGWTPYKFESSKELIAKMADGNAPKRSIFKVAGPARTAAIIRLVFVIYFALGLLLEFAYIVHWAIKQFNAI